jgi:hypothetical protein
MFGCYYAMKSNVCQYPSQRYGGAVDGLEVAEETVRCDRKPMESLVCLVGFATHPRELPFRETIAYVPP